jgi:hypothetical protein
VAIRHGILRSIGAKSGKDLCVDDFYQPRQLASDLIQISISKDSFTEPRGLVYLSARGIESSTEGFDIHAIQLGSSRQNPIRSNQQTIDLRRGHWNQAKHQYCNCYESNLSSSAQKMNPCG